MHIKNAGLERANRISRRLAIKEDMTTNASLELGELAALHRLYEGRLIERPTRRIAWNGAAERREHRNELELQATLAAREGRGLDARR
jgi:hypothetical protein